MFSLGCLKFSLVFKCESSLIIIFFFHFLYKSEGVRSQSQKGDQDLPDKISSLRRKPTHTRKEPLIDQRRQISGQKHLFRVQLEGRVRDFMSNFIIDTSLATDWSEEGDVCAW